MAILAGSQPDSTAAFLYALGFTSIGAALFALTRSEEKGRVPQEAIIGIVFVVASAAAILVADRTPRGGEAIKDILVGSLLWVTLAGDRPAGRGVRDHRAVVHWLLRRRFLTISFQPETALANGWRIRWWDFLFYLSFGIVITFSVPIAGVLLVFSFLVVPAAIAFQFTRRYGPLASCRGLPVRWRRRRVSWSRSITTCPPGRSWSACSACCCSSPMRSGGWWASTCRRSSRGFGRRPRSAQ